jgi:hypothetical protein
MSGDESNIEFQNQVLKSDNLLHNQNYSNLDPKRLFELISKNYEIWQNSLNNQFVDDDGFLPFPQESDDCENPKISSNNSKDNGPIFNYSLLEALENASGDNFNETDLFNEIRLNLSNIDKLFPVTKSNSSNSRTTNESVIRPSRSNENIPIDSLKNYLSSKSEKPDLVSSQAAAKMKKINESTSLLKQSEIDFLRNKISSMISPTQGMSLYDTKDEPGLHSGSGDIDIDLIHSQDDYDVDEILDDDYEYDYSHHIEVEVNAIGNDGQFSSHENEGPSCEFTFEYDHNGKLIPTSSNVEEKIRLMNLQSKINNQKLKLPSISELNLIDDVNATQKKKSKKKKKKKKTTDAQEEPTLTKDATADHDCCLLCEYEIIFGTKPKQLIKWYNQRVRREEQRREEIKKKLENAKLKAMSKKKELSQRDRYQNPDDEPRVTIQCSNVTMMNGDSPKNDLQETPIEL